MWKFLGSAISSFLLLRDLFGYLVPGAILVAVVVKTFGVDWIRAILPDPPIWAAAVVGFTSCYLVGHVCAAIGYTVFNTFDGLRKRLGHPRAAGPNTVDSLYYRYLYPSLFNEADRRDTMTILRIGSAVALLASAILLADWPRIVALGVGVFLLHNGYGANAHVERQRAHAIEAAQRAEKNKLPYFRWDGCCDKAADAKDDSG